MSNCRCCISLADSSTIESLQFPFISINCVVAISPISHGISCSFCNGSRPIVEDRGNVRYTRHKFIQLTQFQEFELMKFTLYCFPFQTLWTLIREPRASPISQLLTSFPPGKQLMPDKLSNLILRSCNDNFWDSTCKDRTCWQYDFWESQKRKINHTWRYILSERCRYNINSWWFNVRVT